jgi:hypothetical protein
MTNSIRLAQTLVVVGGLLVACRAVSADSPAIVRSDSQPKLIRTITFGSYGSKYVRIGDLDGDGALDLLLVQTTAPEGEHKAVITCLTAINLEGKVLWQVGKPDIRNIYFGSDFPVQIHDRDRDGFNEVLYIPDAKNVLTILDGKTGKTLKEVPLAGGHDSLLFADFSGNGYAQDMLVKDRYSSFWVYDKNFKLLWSKLDCNPGHYPMEADIDGDGRDELLCGYTLYDHRGKVLWSHPEFPGHNDAVYISDMNGDGKAEIGIAASAGEPAEQACLLSASGKVLFRKTMNHCQHVVIGKFRRDLPGKQVCFVDRRTPSEISMFTISGDKLWTVSGNIWYVAEYVMGKWVDGPEENFVGLYSRGFAPPCLLDGFGREIATFPFPPAILKPGGGPGGKDLCDDYYVQHADVYGDSREEVLVYNHKALYIYTNGAPVQGSNASRGWWKTAGPRKQEPRMYNNNFYPGRL